MREVELSWAFDGDAMKSQGERCSWDQCCGTRLCQLESLWLRLYTDKKKSSPMKQNPRLNVGVNV